MRHGGDFLCVSEGGGEPGPSSMGLPLGCRPGPVNKGHLVMSLAVLERPSHAFA